MWFRLDEGKLIYRSKGKDGKGLKDDVDSLDEASVSSKPHAPPRPHIRTYHLRRRVAERP